MDKEPADIVKEKLWRYGYSARRAPKDKPWALLVEDKWRIVVKSAHPEAHERDDGSTALMWRIERPGRLGENAFDFLIIVMFREIGKPQILFYPEGRAQTLFRYVDTSVTLSANSKQGEERIEMGETSPLRVFGNPR